jgi:hypothetical protein
MQPSLFPSTRQTVLSLDRHYRYVLWREWGAPDCPYALFVGLNPSTADETTDDPTIRRCIGFARSLGFDTLCMANLFAFRTTYPNEMLAAQDPVGPENDRWISDLSKDARITIAAWGVPGRFRGRDQVVLPMLRDPQCLGVTAGGCPKHPLYLPAITRPIPYKQ